MTRLLAITLVLPLVVSLPAFPGESQTPVLAQSDTARVEQIASVLGLDAPLAASWAFSGKDSSLVSLSGGAGALGYACVDNGQPGPALREVIFDSGVAGTLETNPQSCAQRAVGTAKTLGGPKFTHDGLFSYNLCFQYLDKATGKAEGDVAVDALTGRLSLPGGKLGAAIGVPARPPKGKSSVLSVPRYGMRMSLRATALAMLFGYWADHGFPEVGKKQTKDGLQTEAQYIEEFSRACGACSERTATELFITGRGMMAKIETLRVSDEHPSKDLADKVIAELDAGRPMFVRVTTANVNHYFIICGYVEANGTTFLVAKVPFPEGSADGWGGYYVFSLPTGFESAEFVLVELKAKK